MVKKTNAFLRLVKKGATPFINLVTLISSSRSKQPFNIGQQPILNSDWQNSKPNWISLSKPDDFEKAVRFNPVVKAAINLLATSSSNGKKVAVDVETGEIIPWTTNDPAIRKAYELLILRPNPLQSAKEFSFQGTFYLKTFGNRYVYPNMPIGFNKKVDLLNVSTLINLPSQFVDLKTTGKLYDQTKISGIISEYAVTNTDPVTKYNPEIILHFNEVNVSSYLPTIMGVSKIEVLKFPISNVQKAFEAMNTILTSRGMSGIISPKKSDGMGINIPLSEPEKEEIDKKFKADYGLLNGQNPFLISPIALDYTPTLMNSEELGIYQDFSNNAILIGNEFGVPPELIKTYIKGATYENQVQSVRRLYQDTTIPMVSDEDLYWSYRLDTFKYGFEIQTRWDHIPALQDTFKEKAIALNFKGRTAKDAWDRRIIHQNQYLEMIDQPTVNGGDKIFKEQEDEANKKEVDEEGNTAS